MCHRNNYKCYFIAVLLFLGFVILVLFINKETRAYAISEAEKNIEDALLTHRAIHSFVEEIQKPEIYRLKETGKLYPEYFAPEILSFTYIARTFKEFLNEERQKAGIDEIYFKLAASNPRNPVNRADETELELLRQLNAGELTELKKVYEKDGKKYLYYVKPINPNKDSCMRCHGDPLSAPDELLDMYGDKKGFHEDVGFIRAMVSIRIPLERWFDNAHKTTVVLSFISFCVLSALYLTIVMFMRRIDRQQLEIEKDYSLLEANARLREEVERITRHDLKSPLNAVINYPDLIQSEGNLTERQIKDLRVIKEAGLRVLNMINLSLDLYKMESGTYQFLPHDVNVITVLKNIEQEYAEILKRKKIRIRYFVDERDLMQNQILYIKGKELLFYCLLSNLIQNAIEASPEDGIITLSLTTGEETTITIHNSGTVPYEVKHTFFEKYATHGKKHGTGLGTYSAKLITETLGGHIAMDSAPEKGTTLTVSFPSAKKKEHNVSAHLSPTPL
ncbi:MAG: DUF3365 domain-containing protein [Desulfobulbaceae bacterium]|nr:DUF3365 domain-containing protein [Desulfobulbaceae bacterium]